MCRFNLVFVWRLRLEETYLALNLTRARVLDNTSDITEAQASEFGEIALDGGVGEEADMSRDVVACDLGPT